MKFNKIEIKKDSPTNELNVDSVKMVRLSFTFPVWKNSPVEDILAEFHDSDLCYDGPFGLEEATPTVQDLEKFAESFEGDWYFYHRDLDITLNQIIENSKKSKKK